MHGCQKQLRQILTNLKKDKLIKSIDRMENEESPTDSEKHMKMVHYYYINYKLFVNVVKYKLDQMRKKIESNEKKAQNRTSYVCSVCDSNYSDLDVDSLFDSTDGNLRCNHCHSILEEDEHTDDTVDARTLISRLNEQMKPITDLLKEADSINLAPEVLEPEAQSIIKHLKLSGVSQRPTSSEKDHLGWTRRSTTDIYGDSTNYRVNIGDSDERQMPKQKERPEWMVESTVHPSDKDSTQSTSAKDQAVFVGDKPVSDHQIMADLLTYEGGQSVNIVASQEEEAKYSSSDEEDRSRTEMDLIPDETDSDDSSEHEYTVKIGDRVVGVNEVTSEMVQQMTEEEKEKYKQVYQQVVSQAEYY